MITLALDGSAGSGTIAVFDGAELRSTRTVAMGPRTGDRFFPAVLEALAEAGTRPSRVERVICGAGPGSFTSLRIVAAISKGIAEGTGASLFAVPSLALAVAAGDALPAGRYLVVADALRGEWFAQPCVRSADHSVMATGAATRVLAEMLSGTVASDGATLVRTGPDCPAAPHARGALRLVAGGSATAVDVATWEPAYGRLAEAQVRWEATHGRALSTL